MHLCQRNQPWINYSEICEKFVATLSLKSTIIFVISAALYKGDKNNPCFAVREVMQFCFALQRLWKTCAAYMNEIIVIMQTLNMMSLAVRSMLQLCAVTSVFGSRSLPPRHHHKHTHTHTCLWPAEVCGQPNNERFSVNTVSRLPQTPEPSADDILLAKLSLAVCVRVCLCSYKTLDLLMDIWKYLKHNVE